MHSRPFLAAAALAGLMFLPGIASAAFSATSGAEAPVALTLQRLATPGAPAAARDATAPELLLALTEEEKKLAAKKKAAEKAAAKKKAAEEAAAAKKAAEEAAAKKGAAEQTAAAKKKAAEEAAAAKEEEAEEATQAAGTGIKPGTYTGQGHTCPRWDHSCRR